MKEQSVAWPSVAASLGPAGMKPTEAKKPTFGLVPAEDSSFAYRRARPGGGVTKQLQAAPLERLFFFFRLPAKEKDEREVCRAAFGSGQSWPRRHEADGGQEAYLRACPGGGIPHSPTVGLVPAEAFLIRLPSGSSRRRRN